MYLTKTILEALIDISQIAGEKILEIYADETRFGQVDAKADDSPLTLADQAAHQYIAARLEELTPEIPILSEEGKHLPYEERAQWTRFWLVDPLDGTKEFIKRNGEFTVNIALIEAGVSVMGVVHVPVSNETYYAAQQQGAYVIRDGNPPKLIKSTSFQMNDQGLRLVVSRSHLSPEVEAYVNQFVEPQKVSMGSSLKFMVLQLRSL